MNNELHVIHTRTHDFRPLVTVRNFPGLDAEMTPEQLRLLAAALLTAAKECEARPTKGRHFTQSECRYSMEPNNTGGLKALPDPEEYSGWFGRIRAGIALSRQTLVDISHHLTQSTETSYEDCIRPLIGTIFVLESTESLLDELFTCTIPTDAMYEMTRKAAAFEKKNARKTK